MDDNREEELKEKTQLKRSQKTVSHLLKDSESLLQKKMKADTTVESNHSVKQSPIVNDNDANKQLMDIDLDMESIRHQLTFPLERNLNTPSALSASVDRSTIQSDANQKKIAKVTTNQRVGLSDNDNGQNEAKLNPSVQALLAGTLPDDVYLHLMSVMGIQDCLLSNRLVCSLWNELVLERCRNQRSLKLFETFDNLIDYGELMLKYEKTNDTSLTFKSIGDDLLFEGFKTNFTVISRLGQFGDDLHQKGLTYDENGEICTLLEIDLSVEKKREAIKILTTHFPKIEQLVICASEYNTFINIEHLLKFYAEQLTSLTLTNFGSTVENPGRKLRAFSFPMLKTLNTFNFSPEEGQLLSLLPQLESLTMECAKMSLETLLRTGAQLHELNIKNIQSVYTAPVNKFSKRSPINTNLRSFSFEYTQNEEIEMQSLEFISRNLTSLECLKLYFDNYRTNLHHLHTLIPYLVPLHQLHSLTLQIPVSFFTLDDTQLAEIQPLPSVRHLKLLLFGNASLSSVERFSRALFAAFPHVEQVLIAFVGNDDGRVGTATFAAFEDFASKHTSVVQLFRSKDMSKFTTLPNAVSPLLGHHRQMYEEYIEAENLFGVPICKLSRSLSTWLDTDFYDNRPNLKILLRPADRLTAMSNFFKLLESHAFCFSFEKVDTMVAHLYDCALKYDPSEGAMFIITCKCILLLLECHVVGDNEFDDEFDSDEEYDSDENSWDSTFLDTKYLDVYPFFEKVLKLVKHYKKQKFNDKDLPLQLFNRIVKFLKKFNLDGDDDRLGDVELLQILLDLVIVFGNDEELLSQIRVLIDDQLKMFDSETLDEMISIFIRSKKRVYRVEMARALLRCSKSRDNYFK